MRRLMFGGLIAVTLGMFTGCVVVEDDLFLGDLEVEWSLDNSTSSSACNTFAVDKWDIVVIGPLPSAEEQVATYNCGSFWDTGTSFWNLEIGSYDIEIDAVENGVVVGRTPAVRAQVDDLGLEIINIDFLPTDFFP